MVNKISERNLGIAEDAITSLAKALGLPDKQIVKIIEDGLWYSQNGKLPEVHKYFIDEMKATFDCY